MRKVDWFERTVWLEDLVEKHGLKVGQLVEVEGHAYRYNLEKDKSGQLQHSLSPAEEARRA